MSENPQVNIVRQRTIKTRLTKFSGMRCKPDPDPLSKEEGRVIGVIGGSGMRTVAASEAHREPQSVGANTDVKSVVGVV